MISKQLFCKTIAGIQAQDKKMHEFDVALNKICDSSVVFDADNLYLSALIRLLEEELDDKAGTIQWWLYEQVRKCIWYDFKDGRRMRYDMPTAESLYDYLTLPFEQLPLEVDTGMTTTLRLRISCEVTHADYTYHYSGALHCVGCLL